MGRKRVIIEGWLVEEANEELNEKLEREIIADVRATTITWIQRVTKVTVLGG